MAQLADHDFRNDAERPQRQRLAGFRRRPEPLDAAIRDHRDRYADAERPQDRGNRQQQPIWRGAPQRRLRLRNEPRFRLLVDVLRAELAQISRESSLRKTRSVSAS